MYVRTEYRCLHIFLCLKFYFSSPFFSVNSHSMLFILFSLIPVVTPCVNEFLLLLLPGGQHSKNCRKNKYKTLHIINPNLLNEAKAQSF